MNPRVYEVPTKALNQAVKPNRDKFPEDFLFELTRNETDEVWRSRSQFVTLKRGQNIKYVPYAFTEHGAIMAANVLNSKRAAWRASRLSEPSFVYDKCSHQTLTSRGSWKNWRRNTIASSKLCSMRFGN